MNTKNVQNQLEVSKETIVAQQIDGSKTLLNMLRLQSQIQRGWSRRIDLRLTFDLIDIESGMIVKLPWVNLTSPKAGKQQNWKNWDDAVSKISVHWKMFCALVQWLCYAQLKLKSKKYGRRRNQRRKPKQKEISKSNTQKSQYNATMPLLWLQIHRRNHFSAAINNIPKPCWSFRAGVLLNWSFSFLFFFSRGLRRPL